MFCQTIIFLESPVNLFLYFKQTSQPSLFVHLSSVLFQSVLPPATKLRQGNIFTGVCQSFCSRGLGVGVYASVHAGIHPPDTPWADIRWADTPWQTPPGRHRPWADSPQADTPPRGRHPGSRKHPPER